MRLANSPPVLRSSEDWSSRTIFFALTILLLMDSFLRGLSSSLKLIFAAEMNLRAPSNSIKTILPGDAVSRAVVL